MWFESFSYAGYYALEDLTGENAYDNMSESNQNRIVEALKGGIEYGEGIDYPYEAPELPDYFPRLYKKYVLDAPEQGPFYVSVWNYNNPGIREAKRSGPPPKPQNTMEMGGM